MGKRPTSIRSFYASKVVGRKAPKYRNTKCTHLGIKFDSLKERDRYVELHFLECNKLISGLVCQFKIELKCGGKNIKSKSGRKLSYWVDFTYWDHEQERQRFEDVKGCDTPVSSLKIAMVEAEYGYEIEIVR